MTLELRVLSNCTELHGGPHVGLFPALAYKCTKIRASCAYMRVAHGIQFALCPVSCATCVVHA